MQIYDFLYHVVFQYIFLLSIQLCCYHTFPQRSYTIRMMFIWSRRDETSADTTEAAMASSKDERICLKERIW